MGKQKFTLKLEHITLLSNAYTGWDDCEFGAPEIDPKRPYGNSNVYQDMLEILGVKEIKKGKYEFRQFGKRWLLKGEDKNNIDLDNETDLCDELDDLHKELETALQIVLKTKSFASGLYEAEKYGNDWKLVK